MKFGKEAKKALGRLFGGAAQILFGGAVVSQWLAEDPKMPIFWSGLLLAFLCAILNVVVAMFVEEKNERN